VRRPGRARTGALAITLVFVAILLAAIVLCRVVVRRLEAGFVDPAGHRTEPPLEIVVPRTVFFHPCHGWARLDEGGTVTVGIDDLLRTLVGELSTCALFATSLCAVIGFIMHRFNVAVTGM
jgi:hypothetical protein